MIFITGGTAQGKYHYVQETFGISEAETVDAAVSASCASAGSDSAAARILSDASVRCVVHYQDLIRALLAAGGDPEDYTRQLLKRRPDLVIVMEEIGSGIVPLEKKERIWRESCGRCGCLIAAEADAVVRLVCGIPTVLKGSPEALRQDADQSGTAGAS